MGAGPASTALLLTALALAGCGGGSSSGVPLSTVFPSSATLTVTLNGSGGTAETFALPSVGGYSGTITLTPSSTVNGISLALLTDTTSPSGVPAPVDSALLFVGVTPAFDVALTSMPSFTFDVPSTAPQSMRRAQQGGNSALLLSFFDPTNPTAGYQSGGTCSQNGTAITCAGSNAPLTLSGQQQYVFELSAAPASTGATVISVPAAAPIVCSPPSVTVLVNGTVVINCTEQRYGGIFTLSLANPAVASVQQSDDLTNTFFNVVGLQAGTTTLALRSQPGGTGSVAITVVP